MKKAINLLWAILFALPLFTLTACGDDDDEPGYFKQYNNLLGKTREQVKAEMKIDVDKEDLEGLYYMINDVPNVKQLNIYYSFGNEDYGSLVTYTKAVQIDEYLYNLKYSDVYNFLTKKYGTGDMRTLSDGSTIVEYKSDTLYVWLWQDLCVSYVDRKEYDKATRSSDIIEQTIIDRHRR